MMKAKTVAVLILFLVFLVGCKPETSKRITADASNPHDSIFKVGVTALVTVNDTFSLYYALDGRNNFTKIKPLWAPVKGKAQAQEILFQLPPKTIPNQLRIDLGRNANQKDIFIKKITMKYNAKVFEAQGTLIFSYFRPDFKKTEFDATTGLIRGIVTDGLRQSPSLYPKEGPLSKQIKLLTE